MSRLRNHASRVTHQKSEGPEARSQQSARPIILLALGAALGIALAGSGLVASGHGAGSLPADAVARVNDEIIRRDDYERVVAALEQDRRAGQEAIRDEDRGRILDRLIDEELLVQRGLELGLVRSDHRVRKDLSTAVIDSIVSEFADLAPDDIELQAFYEANKAFFTQPGRVHVRQLLFRTRTPANAAAALERARQALERLRAGGDFAAVRSELADSEIAPLPDAALPPAKLMDYLGPTAARIALSLGIGEVSDPVRSSAGYHVLQVVDRQPDEAPPLAEIQPQVVSEFRRNAGEQALRAYLDDLRARARVELSQQLP